MFRYRGGGRLGFSFNDCSIFCILLRTADVSFRADMERTKDPEVSDLPVLFWKRPTPSRSEIASSSSVYEHSEKAVLILRTPLKSKFFSLQGDESRLGQPSLPSTRSPTLLSRHRLILGRDTLLHSHSEIFLRMVVGGTPAAERGRESVRLWLWLEEDPSESVLQLRGLPLRPSPAQRSPCFSFCSWKP